MQYRRGVRGSRDTSSGLLVVVERWLARGLATAAVVVGSVGALAWLAGGGVFRIGPVSIGLERPARTLALGLALWLLRDATRGRPGGAPAWRTAALVAALAVVLAADSRPRLVGDAHEYVAMASNLAAGRRPALTDVERRAVETAFGLEAGLLDGHPYDLVAIDGRQDFVHFWAYPLLAAPFVAALGAVGASPLAGFTIANVLLLAGAAAVVARRAGPGAATVLFASPILWWVDKAHPEVLVVSVLGAAIALAAHHRSLVLLLVAVPAVQNTGFVPVLAVATAWAWTRRPRPTRRWPATAAAWVLASLNPLYYFLRFGRPFPLWRTAHPHPPGAAELWAPLGDSNLGLAAAWPAVGLLVVGSAVWGVATAVRSRRRLAEVLALGVGAGVLLVASTQAANLNHGGTRGVSRYALWLVPLVVPALAALGGRPDRTARAAIVALGGVSILSLFPEYLPARPERFLSPTPLAAWLWTRHPGVERPLPEVFAERTWGRESSHRLAQEEAPGVVPAATAQCETALVRGDDTSVGQWPLQCTPAAKPEACRRTATLCYAAAGAGGYRFSPAPDQAAFRGAALRRWYWTGAPADALARAVTAAPWAEMGDVDPRDEAYFLAGRRGTGRLHLLTAKGAFAVWFDGRRRNDAWVEPRVLRPATALLVDPTAARELAREQLSPGAASRMSLPAVAPLLLVVVDD